MCEPPRRLAALTSRRNILGCIWRYLELKKMSPSERSKVVKRVSIFAGKSAPGYAIAKQIIRLIKSVSAMLFRI